MQSVVSLPGSGSRRSSGSIDGDLPAVPSSPSQKTPKDEEPPSPGKLSSTTQKTALWPGGPILLPGSISPKKADDEGQSSKEAPVSLAADTAPTPTIEGGSSSSTTTTASPVVPLPLPASTAISSSTSRITNETLKREILRAAKRESLGLLHDKDMMDTLMVVLRAAVEEKDWGRECFCKCRDLEPKDKLGDMVPFMIVVWGSKSGGNIRLSFMAWGKYSGHDGRVDCGTGSIPELIEKLTCVSEGKSSTAS